MKTASEIRDAAKDRVEDFTESGKKAAYAVMGAPVVTGKRIADYAGKVGKTIQKEFEAWVTEGERLSGEVREGKVVSEIKERVDFEQLQDRVEKLKDQLEDVLTNWRETFKPGGEEADAAAKKAEPKPKAKPKAKTTKKPAAKKTATKKPATKKPAAKKKTASDKS